MDFHLLNDFGKERLQEFQGSKAPITPFYAPFYPKWRKSLAKGLYAMASWLEPKYYPPRRLASK